MKNSNTKTVKIKKKKRGAALKKRNTVISVICSVLFYTIYLAAIAAAIFGIRFIVKEITVKLDSYERSLDKYEAEEVFSSHFSPCRFDVLYDMQTITFSEFENKDAYIKYMNEKTDGKEIKYREVSVGLGDGKKYSVSADKQKLAEFTLIKNDSPATPDDTWKLDTVTTFYSADESVSVKLYKTSTLYVNGIQVSDDYITADDITIESNEHLPDGVNGIYLREYKIDGLFLKPEVKAINRHGVESTLVFDDEKNMYVEQITYDYVSDDIKTLTESATQTYAKYLTLDAGIYQLGNYFDKSSKLYKNITTTENKWYTPHVSYEFQNVELKEYYIYDENTFSIRYSSDHIVYLTKNDPHKFTLDFTLYFKNINGKFYIYDMVSNY